MIDKESLKEYAASHTIRQAAEHFRYTEGYLYKVAHENGIRFVRERKDERREKFILENASSMTAMQISDALCISVRKTMKLCRSLGIWTLDQRKRKEAGRKADRNAMIRCLAENGFTYECIGKAFGLTRQAVARIYK